MVDIGPILPYGPLSDLGLTSACQTALSQPVACDIAIAELVGSSYVGSFNNATTTAAVCRAGCEDSIRQLHVSVSASCGHIVSAAPFVDLIDMLWSNWNQSCFSDPTTRENCNDVIAAFPDVENLADLPLSDLCSYCNVEKLSLMQANAYSNVYESNFQSMYVYVASACNISVENFNATASDFISPIPPTTQNCLSGNRYKTGNGDTCDSIALTHNVSASTLYYTNANIHDCSAIVPGTNLCLPLACNHLYTVQENDNCAGIAREAGIVMDDLMSFNSHLNPGCTNLHSTNPYWGSTLCVSAPGGSHSPLNTISLTTSGVVSPPRDSRVAPGTTLNCNEWYVNDGSRNLTCSGICIEYLVDIYVFLAANPSLGTTTCDADLVLMSAYCIRPQDVGNPGKTSISTASISTTTSSSGAASTALQLPKALRPLLRLGSFQRQLPRK